MDMGLTVMLTGAVLAAVLAVTGIVWLASRLDPKSLWSKLLSLFSAPEMYLLDQAAEQEAERKRLDKCNRRKPGRLTDFE